MLNVKGNVTNYDVVDDVIKISKILIWSILIFAIMLYFKATSRTNSIFMEDSPAHLTHS